MLGLTGMRLYGALAGAIAIALFLAWVWRVDSLRARHLEERIACEENHAQFVADVKAQRELARLSDAANKARVEAEQERNRGVSSDAYESLRTRYNDALGRLRSAEAPTHPGGRRDKAVSGPAAAADAAPSAGQGAFVSEGDLRICADNTAAAITWQEWWKSVEAVER